MTQQEQLTAACAHLGLQTDVQIVDIKDRFRWILDFTQSPAHPDFGSNMIKLERVLHRVTAHPIDLRLEAAEDRNKRKERLARGKN